MVNKEDFKKKMKVPAIIAGSVILIVVIAIVAFMNTGKPGEKNDNEAIDEVNQAPIEYKVEYGSDLADETFVINTEDGEQDAHVEDLNPTIDSMIVGETEHVIEVEELEYDVTVTVEDTQNPEFEGIEEEFEFEDMDIEEVEEELSELITASDSVDGELEVTFTIEEIEDEENRYNVEASAVDNNDNETVETFEVVIVESEVEEVDEADEASESSSADTSSSQSEPDNSSSSSSNSSTSSSSNNSESSSSSSGSSSSSSSSSTVAKSDPEPQPEPKPEPEVKPEPKPEPEVKPESDLPTPPTGATLIQQFPNGVSYSYNKNLPDGGAIVRAGVNTSNGKLVSVTMSGTDNDGTNMIVTYNPSTDRLTHDMGLYNFTSDDVTTIKDVAKIFAEAYGF